MLNIDNNSSKTAVSPLLPSSLEQWFDSNTITRLTLDAVSSVRGCTNNFHSPEQSYCRLNDKMLLTLLVYSYATGLYASQEIEEALNSNATIKYLCARERPDWLVLRNFRRANRPLICMALVELFQASLEKRGLCSESASRSWNGDDDNGRRLTELVMEADHRVLRAVHLDSMAMDD